MSIAAPLAPPGRRGPAPVVPLDRARLEDAIAGQGLVSHYQPIVDLARGVVVGYEALARFENWSGGPLPWFDLARAEGRHAALEAAAVRAALTRRARLPLNTFLTVNVAPDVVTSPELREVIEEAGSLDGVVVELTEQARVESYQVLQPALDRLRERGASIAIDDAGAGYAGLRHLLTVRPDFVKLDRELVAGLGRDEARRALVELIGTLAGRLDAWLVAEGVETAEELHALMDLGVPLAQGYFLGRPARDFGRLDPVLAAQVLTKVAMNAPSSEGTLRALVEQVPCGTTAEEAAAALAREDADLAVVLDERDRPREVLAPGRGLRSARSDLRINLDTPVCQAAQRAIGRPLRVRFDPMVCVDNAGRYVGVVRMERLVDALCRGGAG